MKVCFHTFGISEIDDVNVYAATPISQWLSSDKGRWASSHAQNLTYHCVPDPNTFGYRVIIEGDIEDGPLLTEYFIKWPKTKS